MIQDEHLYLAGPVCFYPNGYSIWYKWRLEAEYHGAVVELPNDNWGEVPGDTLAERIINNCDISMRKCTACLANIENHRGLMPDAGTVFELGMANGLGLKCYAYTRDKRPMNVKYMGARYGLYSMADKDGETFYNGELPFPDSITAGCKVVEGTFSDCLRTFMEDIDEESKRKAVRGLRTGKAARTEIKRSDRPLVYVSDCRRGPESIDRHEWMKKVLGEAGFDAVTPTDRNPAVPDLGQMGDPVAEAYNRFDNYQQHIRDCDIFLAVLDDHRGYEVDADVAFESGTCYMLEGKKMYGYMEDGRGMAARTCSVVRDGESYDINGWSTEGDPFPVNMMYGRTPIFNGMSFTEAVARIKEEYEKSL